MNPIAISTWLRAKSLRALYDLRSCWNARRHLTRSHSSRSVRAEWPSGLPERVAAEFLAFLPGVRVAVAVSLNVIAKHEAHTVRQAGGEIPSGTTDRENAEI